MKKAFIIILAVGAFMLALVACSGGGISHTHSFSEGSCLTPPTCSCGEIKGEASGHNWVEATCTTPKTCLRCGETEGDVSDHNWSDATCTAAKTCTGCGATEGEALNHNWQDATCIAAKTCTDCGATEGEALNHNWQDATCTAAKTCTRCEATEGEALNHNWQDATCTAAKTCSRCKETSGKAAGHSYTKKKTAATCTKQGYTTYTCSACKHSYKDDYVETSHKYEDYKCTACGAVDQAHAYEYLVEWTIKNGKPDGAYVQIREVYNGITFGLSYTANYDYLYIFRSAWLDDEIFDYFNIRLDNNSYFMSIGEWEIMGTVKASSFTANTPISYTSYIGPDNQEFNMAEWTRQDVCETLDWLKGFLAENQIGITISDLGFKKY